MDNPMKTLYSRFLLILTPLLAYSPLEAKPESVVGFNFSYGVGARHAGASAPIPTLNLHLKLGRGQLFFEASGSIVVVGTAKGFEYPVSEKGSIYLAAIDGGSIGISFSGNKLGYVYNSAGVNKRGWITSIELYNVTTTKEPSYLYENENVDEIKIFPAISFGYQW